MTQHDDARNDARLADWLSAGPQHGSESRLQQALGATRAMGQRPAWLVSLRGGTIARGPAAGQLRFALVAVVVLMVTLVAGALITGGLIKPKPIPTPVVVVSPDASASPAPAAGRIVYTRWRLLNAGEEDCAPPGFAAHCRRASTFTSNQDGSGERELFPGRQSVVITSSPDGSKVIVSLEDSDGGHLYLTDVDGSQPQLLDTGCQLPCLGDGEYAISPDGTQLAFSRSLDLGVSTIAIMDMATGAVVELDSTIASSPDLGDPCHGNCGEGENRPPRWSPDGSQLIFWRGDIGSSNHPPVLGEQLGSALFIVDVDGGNFHQLTVPAELFPADARWSPDGSLIVFTSVIETLAAPGIDNSQQLNDIYVVRPDGTGLQRLTFDTVEPVGTTDPGEFGARFPSWTSDGRIVFTRNSGQNDAIYQLWVMDSDGANATRLDPSDPVQLTAIGCVACPYPGVDPFITGRPSIAFWIAPR
jgi:Tol biopolymer transport system component